MSALYLGTGEREKGLVRAIGKNLAENPSELKVKILLDFCRGTRVVNGESSCSLLGSLLANKKVTHYVVLCGSKGNLEIWTWPGLGLFVNCLYDKKLPILGNFASTKLGAPTV